MAVRIPQPKLGQLEVDAVRTRGFGVNANPNAFGAEQARVMGELGQNLQRGADTGAGIVADRNRLAEQARKRDEAIGANRTALQSELEFDKRLTEAEGAATPGAVDFAKGQLEAFGTYRGEVLAGFKGGPEARAALELDLMRQERQVFNRATSFEEKARRAHNVGQIESSLADAQGLVYRDPARLEEMVERNLASVAGANLAPEDRAKLEGAVRSSLTSAAWAKLVEQDPRGSLAALRGEGDIPGLEVGDRIKYGGQAEAELRRQENEAERLQAKREAEAEKVRNKAQRVLALRIEDEAAAAARGESIDPGIDRRILETYDPDEANLLLDRLNLQRRVGTATVELGAMTNEQIAATVEKLAPAGPGYEAEAKGQDAVRTAAAAVLRARREDPAAELVRAYPDVGELLNSDDPADIAEGARRSRALQESTFGFQPDQVRLLPKETASRIVERFKGAATVDERVALLSTLTVGLKDDTSGRIVLDQLEAAGLPPGADRAMERWRAGDQEGARAIMGTITMKPEDLPKNDSATSEQVSAAVDTIFAGGEGPAAAVTTAAAFTTEPAMLQAVGRDRALVERLAKTYASQGATAEEAAARASRTVYGGTEAIVSEELGAVIVPDGMYAPAFEETLAGARANLRPPFPEPPRDRFPNEGDYQLALREHAARVEDLRESGRWVNSGKGFVLLNRAGRAVPGPDGKAKVWTAGELMAMQGPSDPTRGAYYTGAAM